MNEEAWAGIVVVKYKNASVVRNGVERPTTIDGDDLPHDIIAIRIFRKKFAFRSLLCPTRIPTGLETLMETPACTGRSNPWTLLFETFCSPNLEIWLISDLIDLSWPFQKPKNASWKPAEEEY